MRNLFVALAACCFSLVAVSSYAAGQTEVEAPATVEAAERVWTHALVTKDEAILREILDEGFQSITEGVQGSIGRDAYLAMQATPERAYLSMTPTIVSISEQGDAVTVVIDMEVGWPAEYADRHAAWRFTDTWSRSNGSWRVLRREGRRA
jgi:hypothetical protein